MFLIDLQRASYWASAVHHKADRAAVIVEITLPLPEQGELVHLPISSLPVMKTDGNKVDLAVRPGWKVIYFWSAACPCVSACERYSFIPLAKQYQGKVAFYGVVSGSYDLSHGALSLQKSIGDRKLPYPIFLDKTHATALALHAQVTPQTFLLNPKNEIVFSGMPDDSRRYLAGAGKPGVTQTYLSDALAQALAGKPITQPKTENQGCIISW
ncbi:MAG: redoxin domain-containing protein [Capsulimonas sp.]|uniref:redoxin domain-containing protein n=1 Tax=Capsulimonas sp. TaxID=2494211 RepID=UPI00326524F4